MKRIVFSIFKQLPIGERVTDYSKSQFSKHYDFLVNNKKQYAQACSADFKLMSFDESYVDLQHRKIQHIETLASRYDQILYLDFDVVVKTQQNIFEHFDNNLSLLVEDASKIVQQEAARVLNKSAVSTIDHYKDFCVNEMNATSTRDNYHRLSKANEKRMMLFEDDIVSKSYMIANTGVILTSAESIIELQYSNQLDYMKSISHFNNNEIFITYLLEKNNVPYNNLGRDWHRVYDDLQEDIDGALFIHAINKRFDDLYD